ncbi:unnamed protein product [Staurois parvus]|uniref:Uncharacterized protein n=1 Tax=Staurois parvus TaxID=386267 RepID=A0ABN9C7T4_9NEOB|nr:unnamed protein product [Staurois parvus]
MMGYYFLPLHTNEGTLFLHTDTNDGALFLPLTPMMGHYSSTDTNGSSVAAWVPRGWAL